MQMLVNLLQDVIKLLKQMQDQQIVLVRNQVAMMSALKRLEEKANGPGGN